MIKGIIDNLRSNAILKSSTGILIITLFIKVLSYFEKLLLGYYFGTGVEVDVYTVVLSAVMAFFFFFREIIEPGFLSVFLGSQVKQGERSWNLFNTLLRFISLLTLSVCVLVFIFPGFFVEIFAPGFDVATKELAIEMITIAFPAVVFLSVSTVTSITLNASKRFVLPASGDLVMKGAIIIIIIVGYHNYGIKAAAFGVVIGALLKLVLHLTGLRRYLSFRRMELPKEEVRQMWQLSIPLLIGVSVSQLGGIVDNMFASYLPSGSISSLSYARKIVELPILLFPYILSIVVFPFFTELSIRREKEKLQELIKVIIQWITIIFVPLSIFFVLRSEPLVQLILQRGTFDATSVSTTADSLFWYSFGMLFFAIETVLVVFYFATGDTKTPIIVGVICVLVNVLLTYLLIQLLGFTGIALALVLSKSIKVITLLALLDRKISISYREALDFAVRVFLSALVVGIFLWMMPGNTGSNVPAGMLTKLATLSIHFTLASLFYFVCLRLLNIQKMMPGGRAFVSK